MSDLVLAKQKQRQKPRKHKPRTWEQLYQALAYFQSEHGHCNVPRDHIDTGLCRWIARQRRNRTELTQDQKSKLESIGFDLRTTEEQFEARWMAKYERLKDFRLLYGHCNVPQSALSDEELKPWALELGVLGARSEKDAPAKENEQRTTTKVACHWI